MKVRVWVKVTFTKRDIHAMLADLAAVCERAHKLIRVRKLSTLHKLKQMCRIRMLEEQITWKRENSFDRKEIIAERHKGP